MSKTKSNFNKNVDNVFQELSSLKESDGDFFIGVPSGFANLDRVTFGWQQSELIVVAGRPAMGKTSFILSACRNASIMHGKPIAYFSLEMSTHQIIKRLISSETEIDQEKFRKGNLTNLEWERLEEKKEMIASAPFHVDDTYGLNVLELREKCRILKRDHNIEMVVIDYLQLMTTGINQSPVPSREQEISFITRNLKELSKELNIPVIVLSQLNRSVETRGGDKRPQLSDLRDSGSIEQDADLVLFLYRPEYYGLDEDEEGNSTKGMGEIIISKNRYGALENVRLKFISSYTKFTDWDNDEFKVSQAKPEDFHNYTSRKVTFDQMNALPPDLDFSDNEFQTLPTKFNRDNPPPSNDPPF